MDNRHQHNMESQSRPTAYRSSSFSSPLPSAARTPETPKTTAAMKAVFSPSPPSKGVGPITPTRPSLTSSVSMPSLNLSSEHPPIPSPAAPLPQSPNYHPYRIRTSSSGVLSRSNASPAQPLASLSGHRPSRSMSNFKEVAESQDGPDDSQQTTPVKDPSKRRSMDGSSSPATWSVGLKSRVGGPVHQRRQTHSRTSSISSMDGVSDGSVGDLTRKAMGIPAVSASASIEGLSATVKTWSGE